MIESQPPHHFRVSSGLKRVIGQDLITNDFVAIFELVKNSFDADAKHVWLHFESDRIVISDDGNGMSRSDVIDKWLFVAFSSKRVKVDDRKDDYREHLRERGAYAGSKGVGRFSCDRLARRLRIESRTDLDPVQIVEIDWDEFETDPHEDFVNIPVSLSEQREFSAETIPLQSAPPSTGTRLIMTGLRDRWERDKLLKLKSNLAKLINPLDNSSVPFRITLSAPAEIGKDNELRHAQTEDGDSGDHRLVNGEIRNVLFRALTPKTTFLEVSIHPTGDSIESKLVDRGELIYHIREANPFAKLRSSQFNCTIIYLNTVAKQTFARRMGVPSVDFGSVFLFRNGFRVFPVGERGDDTFKMDQRKGQGHSRFLGTREVIGRIDVRGDESDFRETTSRDQGLIQTPAYIELISCFWEKCLKRLETYVVGVSWQDDSDRFSEDTSRLAGDAPRARIIKIVAAIANGRDVTLLRYSENLIGILNERSREFENSLASLKVVAERSEDRKLLGEIRRAEKRYAEMRRFEEAARAQADAERLARERAEAEAKKAQAEVQSAKAAQVQAETRAQKVERAYHEEQKRSLFLSSLNSQDSDVIVNLHHQVGIHASWIHQALSSFLDKIRMGETVGQEDMVSLAEGIIFRNQQILAVSKFATKANFRLSGDLIHEDLVRYMIEYVLNICALYQGSGVRLEVEPCDIVWLRQFRPLEVSMLIDNLVSNSVKASAGTVHFSFASPSPATLEIRVTDDGLGLAEAILEPSRVFEKGFSTTDGSGLGLYHSRQIVEQLGGSIAIHEGHLGGAQIIIRIKK